jgi:hypothetical protein
MDIAARAFAIDAAALATAPSLLAVRGDVGAVQVLAPYIFIDWAAL